MELLERARAAAAAMNRWLRSSGIPAPAVGLVQAALWKILPYLLLFLCLERLSNIRRYGTRNFRTDVLYALFYAGGVFSLIYHACYSLLELALGPLMPILRWHVLLGMPQLAAGALFIVFADFYLYWMHRCLHSNRILWSFHSIHHSQTELTYLTSSRIHPFEQLFLSLGFALPGLILGEPKLFWVMALLWNLQESVQHAELNWSYGPLYRVVVGPVFHRIHHSTDPSVYNTNFGKLFALWDWVFGTLSRGNRRPAEVGLRQPVVPESFLRQLPFPLWAAWAGFPAAKREPRTPPAAPVSSPRGLH